MQVEHKTEKGTVLFVKDEEISETLNVCSKSSFIIDELLKDTGIIVIGPTSEVTEDQAKMMVKENDELSMPGYGWNDYNGTSVCDDALDSFKSLMQHLQVYEINPHTILEGENKDGWWQEAEARTGKWVVLFKFK